MTVRSVLSHSPRIPTAVHLLSSTFIVRFICVYTFFHGIALFFPPWGWGCMLMGFIDYKPSAIAAWSGTDGSVSGGVVDERERERKRNKKNNICNGLHQIRFQLHDRLLFWLPLFVVSVITEINKLKMKLIWDERGNKRGTKCFMSDK